MKVNTNFSSHQAMVGAQESHALRINDSSQAMIIDSLINLYSDPVGSIVRELTSNAIDSHRERDLKRAGQIPLAMEEDLKWFEDRLSVEVALVDRNPLIGIEANISFTDFGMGLSPQRVKDIYTVLGTSTKRDDNHQIGGFGLGCKSPWSYTDSFYVNTRFNGTEYYYLMHKGESVPSMDLVFTQDTDKKNGTTVIVPLKMDSKHHEIGKFATAINEQLMFFKNVSYVGDFDSYRTLKKPNIIEETEDFVITTNIALNSSEQKLLVGNVMYPLDSNLVDSILLPGMVLKVGIGELDLVPSREAVRYTPRTIAAIEAKMVLVKADAVATVEKALSDVTDLTQYLTYKKNFKSSYYTRKFTECGSDLVSYKYQLTSSLKVEGDLSKWDLDIEGIDTTNMWYAFRTFQVKKKWVRNSNSDGKLEAVSENLYNGFDHFKNETMYHVQNRFSARTNMALNDLEGPSYCFKETKCSELSASVLRSIKDDFDYETTTEQLDEKFEKVRQALYKHFNFKCIKQYEDIDTSAYATVTLNSEETSEQRRKRLGTVFAKRYYSKGNDYSSSEEYNVSDLLSKEKGGTFVYGFSADAEKLATARALLSSNYTVVKVSKQVEKHFARQIHVDDLIEFQSSLIADTAQEKVDNQYAFDMLAPYKNNRLLKYVNKEYFSLTKTSSPCYYESSRIVNKILTVEVSKSMIDKVAKIAALMDEVPMLNTKVVNADNLLLKSLKDLLEAKGIEHCMEVKTKTFAEGVIYYCRSYNLNSLMEENLNSHEVYDKYLELQNAIKADDVTLVTNLIAELDIEWVIDVKHLITRNYDNHVVEIVEQDVNQFALAL